MTCSPIPSPLLFIFVTRSPISLMLSTFKEDGYHLNILLACSPRKFSSRKSVRWASPCPPATLWMSSNAAFTVFSSSSEACSQPGVNVYPPINAQEHLDCFQSCSPVVSGWLWDLTQLDSSTTGHLQCQTVIQYHWRWSIVHQLVSSQHHGQSVWENMARIMNRCKAVENIEMNLVFNKFLGMFSLLIRSLFEPLHKSVQCHIIPVMMSWCRERTGKNTESSLARVP